jgi:hypothetical protein
MKLHLLSHVNGDGDLLEAWFQYYLRLGITSFHLVVHGTRSENDRLYALRDSYPVVIEDHYDGEFTSQEKKRRLDALLAVMRDQWLVLVDSDEFVEFPYRRIPTTIRALELARSNILFAPMLQRLMSDGSLDAPDTIENPFRTFPLCSVELYKKMGSKASIRKFPLFYCFDGTVLSDGGNHNPPWGHPSGLSSLQGVTHHFKFRRRVRVRLDSRIQSSHLWRHESVQFREYLDRNRDRLPLDDAFLYSRNELFRRNLLHRFTLGAVLRSARRRLGAMGNIGKHLT